MSFLTIKKGGVCTIIGGASGGKTYAHVSLQINHAQPLLTILKMCSHS